MRSLLANLRVRFLLLVLVAVLPALALLVFTAAEQRDQAVAAARNDARRLVGLAAADHDRLIESTRQLLVVLARLPAVLDGGPACDGLLADLRAQFPLYANLGVIAPDGALVCSAVPPPAGLNLADRAYFRGAVESGAFAVGEFQTGRVTGKPALNCGYPILDAGGTLRGVVYAALDLATFGQFTADAQLPEGATVTVLDRGGTVLVRRPDAGDLVGRSLVGTPVVDTILAERTGVTEGREGDDRYLYAFADLGGDNAGRAAPSSAFLSLAIPRAQVLAPADRAFNDNLTRLGVVVMVSLVAAWVGGDLLARRNTEVHKDLVRRVYDAFASGGVDLLDDVVAADFRDWDPMPGQVPGLAGLKQAVGMFRAAFPDGEMVVDELIAEGDKVAARVTLRGTHQADFCGIPPSGRAVRVDGIELFRVAGGKIVEGWSRFPSLATATEATTDAVETTPATPAG